MPPDTVPELLPCPFCGGEARCSFVSGMAFDWKCGCVSCDIYARRRANHSEHHDPVRDTAIEAWNTRALAAPPAPVSVAQLDRLDAIIRELAGDVAPGGPEDRAWAVIEEIRAALGTATAGAGEHDCPICAQPFKSDDLCATDIELGICHAACLHGSPAVNLETGEPSNGPIETYRYGAGSE